jgi:hypothetical protein
LVKYGFRIIRQHARNDRPLGSEAFIEDLEQVTGGPLKKSRAPGAAERNRRRFELSIVSGIPLCSELSIVSPDFLSRISEAGTQKRLLSGYDFLR